MSRQLLVHGGPILTMDPEHPIVEAALFQFGKVAAVGSLDDVRRLQAGPVDTIDLAGRLASPGLNDAHAHIMGTGFAQAQIDVSTPNVSAITDIRRLVAERASTQPAGTWIVGQGYDQASLSEQRHPTRQDLDSVAPHHPVLLWRSCHHIAAVNTVALRMAGIDRNTSDTADGTADRDEHGEPTGVVREAMIDAVQAVMAALTEAEIANAIQLGGEEFRRWGVTSTTEAKVTSPAEIRAYQQVWQEGRLPLRTALMTIMDDLLDYQIGLGIGTGFGDDWLHFGPVKLFSDGSIGGRTARLREPYVDEPDNFGLWMISPAEIEERVVRAHTAGYQIGIHAIGDAAIETVLDAYAKAQAAFPRTDARHRIEHCSLVDLKLLQRIKDQSVIPIPGTTFLYYTRPAYLQNLGPERVRYAYAMKTFIEMGIIAAASSDAPVVPPNPMLGIQTMVARQDRLGDAIYPEEAISVEEALRAYTWNGAYASHSEHRKGALRPGYLGDMTIFDSDLRSVAPQELEDGAVDYTIADGTVVFQR